MDDGDGATRSAKGVVSWRLRFVDRLRFSFPLLLIVQSISSANGDAAVRESKNAFESGGEKVTVEIYAPATTQKHPGVLLLHGAGGMFLDGPAIRRFARAIAQNGFAAFVIHYFERSGTTFARNAVIHKNFDAWRSTVSDAIDYVASQTYVDPEALGCFGYSLGGYLSLAQAAHDRRIRAVVELAGAIDKDHVGLVKRPPPILILHGEEDHRVPVENAFRLEKILQRLRVLHEMKIYRAEGHVLSTASQVDAAARAVHFFQENLIPAR